MPGQSSPYLVRVDRAASEPGVHAHNRARRLPLRPRRVRKLRGLRITLFALGIAATGYYGYTLANERVYQAYENWAFDRQIEGRSNVNFADYLREQTPYGFLVGAKKESPAQPVEQTTQTKDSTVSRPPDGSILGRVQIARLNISAVVREGVSADTLSRAVGHVPSTSLPGKPGNFAIAAHRDTLFRALKNIRLGDSVLFQSSTGSYVYRVIATQIVKPSDVSVLRSDGGPTLQQVADRPTRLLTMITCYPFNYIGAAPQRFIVQAAAVDGTPSPLVRTQTERAVPAAHVVHALRGPPRANPLPRRVPSNPASQRPTASREAQNKHRKRGFWRRMFHSS
jgi:sortase A